MYLNNRFGESIPAVFADITHGKGHSVKVSVNMERCVGHGMCRMACPEIFALDDDDGKAIVLQSAVPFELQPAVEQAERGCPEQAVIIEYQ